MTTNAAHLETLESIKYTRGHFTLLDQRQLPFKTIFDEVKTTEDIWTAIREMRVRGAPAIAVSGMLGIAIAVANEAKANPDAFASPQQVGQWLTTALDYVGTSRPTAVNLFNAIKIMHEKVPADVAASTTGAEVIEKFTLHAEAMYNEDIAFNEGIMRNGAAHIIANDSKGAEKVSIMTICNTGALATSRYGTALGVVRELHYTNRLEQVYACETRPWNQGARLTVYECVKENMPATLICDSAASSLMRSRQVHAVIVGADRICKNGDTANKIGTYNLAVAAKYHGVPFYVAAPSTTLDANTPSGDKVEIEERETTEITHNMATKERCVAEGPNLSIWNPVFDITPAELITGGIITEKTVLVPKPNATCPNSFFDITEAL